MATDHVSVVVHRGARVAAGVFLVALAVVVSLAVAAGHATGSNAGHCARVVAQSQARERIVTGHGRNVVVIGDSYSVGFGLRDQSASWPSQLPGRVHVYGVSGSGFSAGASPCAGVSYDAREPYALRRGADLVVVEGGLNDFDQPVSTVRAGFRALARELRGHRVLVVGPPPAPARLSGARRVDAVLSQESARAGVRYLSMIDEHFRYLPDRLHLTPSGHHDFGQVVARSVRGS